VCGSHLFVPSNDEQAGLELLELAVVAMAAAVAARNGSKFSQCNVAWRGFTWARVLGFLLVLYFYLMKEGKEKEREKKKKKSPWGRRVSLGLDPSSWL
jgi:hypothetical protein